MLCITWLKCSEPAPEQRTVLYSHRYSVLKTHLEMQHPKCVHDHFMYKYKNNLLSFIPRQEEQCLISSYLKDLSVDIKKCPVNHTPYHGKIFHAWSLLISILSLNQFKITFGNQHFLQQKTELDKKKSGNYNLFFKKETLISLRKKKSQYLREKLEQARQNELQPVTTWSERVKLPVYFNSSSFFSRVREVVCMTTQL